MLGTQYDEFEISNTSSEYLSKPNVNLITVDQAKIHFKNNLFINKNTYPQKKWFYLGTTKELRTSFHSALRKESLMPNNVGHYCGSRQNMPRCSAG